MAICSGTRATRPLQPQERRLADLQFNDLAI
jgi:hypothetical protein